MPANPEGRKIRSDHGHLQGLDRGEDRGFLIRSHTAQQRQGGTGVGDAGEADGLVEDADGIDAVAEVLEGLEDRLDPAREIEIAGLADATVVVLVPEAGDEVQTMKAGLMEIADIFVVNKSDRPEANHFATYLKAMTHAAGKDAPVISTVASEKKGLPELASAITQHLALDTDNKRKALVLAERAYQLIRNQKMKSISKSALAKDIEIAVQQHHFNLYHFIQSFDHGK